MYALKHFWVMDSKIFFLVNSVNSSIQFDKRLIVKREKESIDQFSDYFFNLTV